MKRGLMDIIHLIIPGNRYINGVHIKKPQEKEYTYQATQYYTYKG